MLTSLCHLQLRASERSQRAKSFQTFRSQSTFVSVTNQLLKTHIPYFKHTYVVKYVKLRVLSCSCHAHADICNLVFVDSNIRETQALAVAGLCLSPKTQMTSHVGICGAQQCLCNFCYRLLFEVAQFEF